MCEAVEGSLSQQYQDNFDPKTLVLTVAMFVVIMASVAVLVVLMASEVRAERQRQQSLLRWEKDRSVVLPTRLEPARFHAFLSQCAEPLPFDPL